MQIVHKITDTRIVFKAKKAVPLFATHSPPLFLLCCETGKRDYGPTCPLLCRSCCLLGFPLRGAPPEPEWLCKDFYFILSLGLCH